MDKNFIIGRIERAEADLKTLQSVELHNRHLMVDLLKNRIQEWREMLEDMEG